VRLVQKIISIARRRFRVLVNRDDDGLDVLVAPTFSDSLVPHVVQRLEERSPVRRKSTAPAVSPFAPSQYVAFTRLRLLEPVAFGAQRIDLCEHSREESFGCNRGPACNFPAS
jgi:hypothetical protein